MLGHVVNGRLNKQIAANLGAAEKTVKIHRARVMRKMGAESVAALVRMAEKAGVAAGGPPEPGASPSLPNTPDPG